MASVPDPAGAAPQAAVAKDPKGIPGLVMKMINEFGPGACREQLIFSLVELFEIDLDLAKNFVSKLQPKDLMSLGQAIMHGGFPFEKCTELVKMKVEMHTFLIPVDDLADGLGEEEMSFSFGGMGSPPTVIGINDDWVDQTVAKT